MDGPLEAVHKRRRQFGGGRVKIALNMHTNRSKKCSDMGKGVSKYRNKSRRLLWMVPILTIHSSLFGVYSKLLYTQYEMSRGAKRRPLKCIVEKLHILQSFLKLIRFV